MVKSGDGMEGRVVWESLPFIDGKISYDANARAVLDEILPA